MSRNDVLSERIALLAMEFLRKMKRAVPENIQVIGFDNSLQSFSHDITSFDFNLAITVQEMFNHLILQTKKGSDGLKVIPGRIVQRGSTREM